MQSFNRKEAPQELFELIAKHFELVERVTIAIKPNKALRGTDAQKAASRLVGAAKAAQP